MISISFKRLKIVFVSLVAVCGCATESEELGHDDSALLVSQKEVLQPGVRSLVMAPAAYELSAMFPQWAGDDLEFEVRGLDPKGMAFLHSVGAVQGTPLEKKDGVFAFRSTSLASGFSRLRIVGGRPADGNVVVTMTQHAAGRDPFDATSTGAPVQDKEWGTKFGVPVETPFFTFARYRTCRPATIKGPLPCDEVLEDWKVDRPVNIAGTARLSQYATNMGIRPSVELASREAAKCTRVCSKSVVGSSKHYCFRPSENFSCVSNPVATLPDLVGEVGEQGFRFVATTRSKLRTVYSKSTARFVNAFTETELVTYGRLQP